MTRLINSGSVKLFNITTSGNTSTIKNFVLDASNGAAVAINAGASVNLTADGNTTMTCGTNGISTSTTGTHLIQNNIVLEAYQGISELNSSGKVINNTVVNATYRGLSGGTRKNNIAYGSGKGYSRCGGSYGSATYSDAYLNTTNYDTSCDGGNNLTSDPQFTDSYTGISTGLTASTLTKSGAGWTTDEWKGYFVAPDSAATPAQYFLIVSNTDTVLTVQSRFMMTDYAYSGLGFQITDLTLQSGSGLINTGTNTGAPSDDIYGTSRPQDTTTDMGATEYPASRRRPMIVR